MSRMSEPILVAGGTGFLGSHLVDELRRCGYEKIRVWGRKDGDLLHPESARRAMRDIRTVFLLAARVGGIGANQEAPYHFWRESLLPGLHILHEAVSSRTTQSLIFISSIWF